MEVCLFAWVLKTKKRCILGLLQVACHIYIPVACILLCIPHCGTCITLWLVNRHPWQRAIVSYIVKLLRHILKFPWWFLAGYTVYATNELSVHLNNRMSTYIVQIYTLVAISQNSSTNMKKTADIGSAKTLVLECSESLEDDILKRQIRLRGSFFVRRTNIHNF